MPICRLASAECHPYVTRNRSNPACFRAWGARPFGRQDIALARLFWEECVAQIVERDESPLSRRQCDTLRLLLEGDSAKAIASKLALSVHTVNEYIKTVYRAKGVRSRAELMARELTGPRGSVGVDAGS